MSRYNPHHKNAENVYRIAEQFKTHCLLEQRSIFLTDELLWTPPHFAALKHHYVDQPDVGVGGFYQKLEGQLATCDPLDVALMAEIFWIVQLAPTNLHAPTKAKRVQRIWMMGPPSEFPMESPFLKNDALSGLGSAGVGYNQYLWMEVVFAVEAFSDFSAKPLEDRKLLLDDGWKFSSWLDGIPSGKGRQLYHTLCHVLFPDLFERIFSQSQKVKVARAHKVWSLGLGEDRPRLDATLLELRKRLEAQHSGLVDHYSLPVGTLVEPAAQSDPAVRRIEGDGPLAEFMEDESLDDSALPNTAPTFRTSDNLILFGPPGTGKTYLMQERMKAAFDAGEDFAFVSFHPSYSYEDFVGGLRPTIPKDGSGIAVTFKKGHLLEICEKAHANPTQRFTLFIDEINRANVAKVFGELITLIEPSKRVMAGSKPSDQGAWLNLAGLSAPFGLPDNLDFVATMNTADRSIAQMDVALRRRFRFQECAPEPELIAPRHIGAVDLALLLERLNERIEYLLDRDHAIGHALLMGVQTIGELRAVLSQKIIPLLQEYFFEDMNKVRLVLTGNTKESVFFKSRPLKPAELFPGHKEFLGAAARTGYVVGDPSQWTEEEFVLLYNSELPIVKAAEENP